MSNDKTIKRGIILADLQYPNHNAALLASFEKYLASQKWDYLVYLGDFADMDALSRHAIAGGDNRQLEGKRLAEDYRRMGDILRRHREIVGPDCEITFLLGNHCEWAEKFVNKFPMLEGMIEIESNLPFEELGIKVIDYRGSHRIADLHFVHGDFSAYTPVFHAKKNVDTFNRNLVYGHHHSIQVATRVAPADVKRKFTATCIPAMCDIDPKWAGHRPNSWLNGFGVFYTFGNNHNLYPIIANRSTFISPEGNLYK